MGRTYCIVREDNCGSPRIYGVKHPSILVDAGSMPAAPIFYFIFFRILFKCSPVLWPLCPPLGEVIPRSIVGRIKLPFNEMKARNIQFA
jgi:hypothetical protein